MAYSNKYNKEEYIEKKKEEIDKLESILKDGVKEGSLYLYPNFVDIYTFLIKVTS